MKGSWKVAEKKLLNIALKSSRVGREDDAMLLQYIVFCLK